MIHCSIQLELGLIRPQSSQTLYPHLPFAEKYHNRSVIWIVIYCVQKSGDIQFPLQGFQNMLYTFFHHSVDVDCVVGSVPLEMRSGLDWDGTSPCCWCCSWMRASLAYRCLPFVRWTMYPCENNWIWAEGGSFIVMWGHVSLHSLDKNVAAQSSSLGMVSSFRGATLDVEHKLSYYCLERM